eukprot:5123642-Alexandrium_andersonii.AAC.1
MHARAARHVCRVGACAIGPDKGSRHWLMNLKVESTQLANCRTNAKQVENPRLATWAASSWLFGHPAFALRASASTYSLKRAPPSASSGVQKPLSL